MPRAGRFFDRHYTFSPRKNVTKHIFTSHKNVIGVFGNKKDRLLSLSVNV